MSVAEYQNTVNSLDKEIASLKKKKAESDKKVGASQKKQVVFQSVRTP